MRKQNKRGISLIVLVITIIVIIILAAAVILTLTNNNPIENARQAAFLNDLDTFQSELNMYKASEYASNQGDYEVKSLFATGDTMTYGGQNQDGKNIYTAISSLKGKTKYENKFEIIEGNLCYIGTNSKEREWAPGAGVEVLSDEPTISITALTTLPIKAGVNATYSVGMSCGIPMIVPTFSNTNIKVLNESGTELGTQPPISGVVTGTENKKTAEITIDTTGMAEGVYKIKVLANAVQTSTTGNEEIIGTGTFEIDNTAPTMPSIDITPSTPTSGDVTVTLGGKPDNTYKLEYSTDGTNWTVYTTTITVTNNLTIHARLTDSANNESEEAIMVITNIDKIAPENATLNVSTTADKVNGTLTLTDSGTGIELSQSKYMVTTQSTIYAVNATEWNTATAFSVNPQTISVTKTDGDYYVHTLSVDKAGNKRVNISSKITVASTTINAPVLAAGMTPIKWSGTTVTTTTSSDSTWYNYESKQWANARTVDGSMWVWIPRYEYKIPTRSSTAQTVAVNFIPTTQTTPTSGYTIHPAFTFGSTGLAGIWVAKFEASGSTSSINVVPEVSSLRSVSINDIFTACLSMATNTAKYGWSTTNLDTHLMKNVEWGSVAYLTQSTYGKNSEVWINPDSNYTTGRAGTSVSASSTTSTYAYNNATYGVQASTTGNVYGIYDMSGCAWEYVAGYVNNGNANLSTYGNSLYTAGSQYKDVYTSSGDTMAGNYSANASKVGDAVYETSTSSDSPYTNSWFADYSYMPYSSGPFFVRGGYYSDTTSAGVFAFISIGGSANSSIGFRPVVALGSGL
jgi:type II secretory pathway pseudopilin PulG